MGCSARDDRPVFYRTSRVSYRSSHPGLTTLNLTICVNPQVLPTSSPFWRTSIKLPRNKEKLIQDYWHKIWFLKLIIQSSSKAFFGGLFLRDSTIYVVVLFTVHDCWTIKEPLVVVGEIYEHGNIINHNVQRQTSLNLVAQGIVGLDISWYGMWPGKTTRDMSS